MFELFLMKIYSLFHMNGNENNLHNHRPEIWPRKCSIYRVTTCKCFLPVFILEGDYQTNLTRKKYEQVKKQKDEKSKNKLGCCCYKKMERNNTL